MEDGKKMILGMMLISVFVLMVGISSFYVQTQIEIGNVCGCLIPIPIFIPFLASVGLFIGTLVYYFLSPKFEPKKIDKNVFMKIFDNQEKELINHLLKNEGESTQARIVRDTGMSKVRVFRLLENLRKRDIVSKVPHGKTNLILFDKNLLQFLK